MPHAANRVRRASVRRTPRSSGVATMARERSSAVHFGSARRPTSVAPAIAAMAALRSSRLSVLLLVVPLKGYGVTGFEQRLQRLDDGSGLQDLSLHPGRDPDQPCGLLRPAARPTVGLAPQRSGRIQVAKPSGVLTGNTAG